MPAGEDFQIPRTPEQMHFQNLARFGKIDSRLTALETKVDTGISIARWIGGAIVAVLSVLVVQLWMHP